MTAVGIEWEIRKYRAICGAYNLQISHDAKKINKKSGNSKTSGVQNRLAHRQSEFETVNSELRQKIQVRG